MSEQESIDQENPETEASEAYEAFVKEQEENWQCLPDRKARNRMIFMAGYRAGKMLMEMTHGPLVR